VSETTLDFSEFDFSGSMRDLASGLLVKPVLHNYLFDARFPAFTLNFPEQQMERAPDGWYHPSTHPLWPARALYQYLAHPDTFPAEKKQYFGTLAVTMGKVVHEFVQMCLTDAGIRPADLQVCESCKPGTCSGEPGFVDADLGERGHLDGLLSFEGFPNVDISKVFPVFEFKTSHDNFGKLSMMEDLDLAGFRKKWPVYYAQQQRYMRLSKRAYSIVLMMETSYPFAMREFHIPLDQAFNADVDAKYRSVRQAVADQRPPLCCGLKGCDSAPVCGVK
jgi:hypothetical protein